ncbi:MAG: DinB family protein [Planctomycetaceae bacterium]|nr:DinB family protein [Planctomycetaceae bacterium]
MLDFFQQCVTSQFEAALCMLKEAIEQCPPEHWDGRIAQLTFRQVAYHTLFFVDVYLSPSEQGFELRELHQRGGDEREPIPCPGLSQVETLAYLTICREKLLATLAAESPETLQGPSGFAHRRFSRGELHLYNLRHVQHHTGQLSAHLRRVDERFRGRDSLTWIGQGWR